MTFRGFFTILTPLLLAVVISGSVIAQNPGFKEGVFSAKTIQDMLNKNNCDGIRFYNTLSGNTVELMGISISGRKDMNGGLFNWHPYDAAIGMDPNGIKVDHLSNNKAKDHATALKNSSYDYYAVDFKKSDVEKIMAHPDANAVKLTPENSNGNLTMRMEAVKFDSGTIQSIGTGSNFELIGDPCPPHCGSATDYIVRP